MRYLLHDVFIEKADCCPEKTAIVLEDGSQYSYLDLYTYSNKYGNLLLSLKDDIKRNPYVGILSTVHYDSIACVLGTLMVGGVYVPLDEYSPIERLLHIVKNTRMDTIAVDSNLYHYFSPLFLDTNIKRIILLNDDVPIDDNVNIINHSIVQNESSYKIPLYNQVSDDLAYILHSSGSTGVPKGIMLTHRNARTFVDWMKKEFGICEKDRVMARAPFKFDLSVFDIFCTLSGGATLICYDWNKKREGNQKHLDYVKLMEREKATILYTTPSTYITLLNKGDLANAQLSLRTIMYAGEPFSVPQLRKLRKVLPCVKIANIYGPTETNIVTYYWINCLPQDDNESIPLGNVVDDTEIIVVSEDGRKICSPMEIGELWCRGGTVTKGYLGMEEKTRECLVLSPFHSFPVYFWRTGDFGYRDYTGCLHYRGRKDHMIKVKGYRIEIGEVEKAVSSYSLIDEFAVVAKSDPSYGNRLYCYFSSLKNISVEELKKHLSLKIPDYMIPYRFIQLSCLPKTSSGKIDRVLLRDNYKNEND